jgi:hypothetical protein
MLQCAFYLGLRAPARFATDSITSLFVDQTATLSGLIHSESSEDRHLSKVLIFVPHCCTICSHLQPVRVVNEWVHCVNGNEGISLLWCGREGGGANSGECRHCKGEATH